MATVGSSIHATDVLSAIYDCKRGDCLLAHIRTGDIDYFVSSISSNPNCTKEEALDHCESFLDEGIIANDVFFWLWVSFDRTNVEVIKPPTCLKDGQFISPYFDEVFKEVKFKVCG